MDTDQIQITEADASLAGSGNSSSTPLLATSAPAPLPTPIDKKEKLKVTEKDKKKIENKSCQKSVSSSKFSVDQDIENCLANETQKQLISYDKVPLNVDLSHLNGRLGVDMYALVRGYHSNNKSM